MNITIRANGRDAKTVEQAKTATGEATASKALLRAARAYPDMRRLVRDLEARLAVRDVQWQRVQDTRRRIAMLEADLADARAELAALLEAA